MPQKTVAAEAPAPSRTSTRRRRQGAAADLGEMQFRRKAHAGSVPIWGAQRRAVWTAGATRMRANAGKRSQAMLVVAEANGVPVSTWGKL